jgi:probable addiction module antidote protein
MVKASKSFHDVWVDRLKKDPKLVAEYIKAEVEENSDSPEALISALRTVAEALGFEELAGRGNFGQKSLYKILSDKRDSKPQFETVFRLLDAIGLRLTVERKPRRKKAS